MFFLVARPAFSTPSAFRFRLSTLGRVSSCSRRWSVSSARAVALSTRNEASPPAAPLQQQSSMFRPDTTFASLGISSEVCETLAAGGIVQPTHVQAEAIPRLYLGLKVQLEYARGMLGAREAYRKANDPDGALPTLLDAEFQPPVPPRDGDDVLMIGAETGSGKTLAYLLPFVEALRNDPDSRIKAVVLQPTRELCFQTERFLRTHIPNTPRTLCLAGGQPPDVSDLAGVRVFVATPTSLITYMRFSQDFLRNDKYIVVDEADMLLDGSFLEKVKHILDQPSMKPFATRRNSRARAHNRNRLVFVGATYPHWTGDRVKSIVNWIRARYPGVRECTTEAIHRRSDRLESTWRYVRDDDERFGALEEVLGNAQGEKVMVFAYTAARAEDLFNRVGDSYGTAAQLHKKMTVRDRAESLRQFASNEARVLFCTDVASRGLDLGHVTRVVEYDFATNVVAHLHRIGRTARAGAAGRSDSFFDDTSKPLADAIRTRSSRDENVVDGVFSRNRSFRRKLKKRLSEVSTSTNSNGETLREGSERGNIDYV